MKVLITIFFCTIALSATAQQRFASDTTKARMIVNRSDTLIAIGELSFMELYTDMRQQKQKLELQIIEYRRYLEISADLLTISDEEFLKGSSKPMTMFIKKLKAFLKK